MKNIQIILLCLVALTFSNFRVQAKTGTIPTYRSFVLWIEGNDSVYGESRTLLLNSAAPDSSVTISIRHQDWNKQFTDYSETILQPWHSTMATHHGIQCSVDNTQSNVGAINLLRAHQKDMPMAMDILAISDATEPITMEMNTQYLISNNGKDEIMVNDMNRGATWYIPSGMYLIMDMGKLPQASLLRICNANSRKSLVKYAYVGSASFSMKYTIAYECDDYWVYNLNEEITVNGSMRDFTGLLGLKDQALRTHYIRRDKCTFQETELTESEVYNLNHQSK